MFSRFPSVHYVRKSMRTSLARLAHLVLLAVICSYGFAANGAQAKPDRKKSQTAFERGRRADELGHRDEAIGAYTESLQLDSTNVAALRARAEDYLAAGDRAKALVDIERAVEMQPADPQGYAARGNYFF